MMNYLTLNEDEWFHIALHQDTPFDKHECKLITVSASYFFLQHDSKITNLCRVSAFISLRAVFLSVLLQISLIRIVTSGTVSKTTPTSAWRQCRTWCNSSSGSMPLQIWRPLIMRFEDWVVFYVFCLFFMGAVFFIALKSFLLCSRFYSQFSSKQISDKRDAKPRKNNNAQIKMLSRAFFCSLGSAFRGLVHSKKKIGTKIMIFVQTAQHWFQIGWKALSGGGVGMGSARANLWHRGPPITIFKGNLLDLADPRGVPPMIWLRPRPPFTLIK